MLNTYIKQVYKKSDVPATPCDLMNNSWWSQFTIMKLTIYCGLVDKNTIYYSII